MHAIINNSSEMKRIYQAYNAPIKNVVHTTMNFQEYRSKRLLPQDRYEPILIDLYKKEFAREVFEAAEENIEFRIDEFSYYPCIEARLYVGKRG